jgi:hypothetical protein
MKKLKTTRVFLEPVRFSDSYTRTWVDDDDGGAELKISDCDRRVSLYFGKPGNKRAIAKIRKLKAVIDALHDYLTEAAS